MYYLIVELINDGYLKTDRLISAFKKIKREDFVQKEDKREAHINAPLAIGHGQTISQPLTVAFMLELLQPQEGEKILDIGSGSGWTTALLAQLVGKEGRVYAFEIVPELKDFGEKNVAKYNFIKKGVVTIKQGDGSQGLPESAPFDKILVSAAAPEVPGELLVQLKVGGLIVIPVGRPYETQTIKRIKKTASDKFEEEDYPGFIFVPLVRN